MIRLFEHNQSAYLSAVELLEEKGKAAVIHPTGTGKSFIAFKMAEANPDALFVWLSPSENIYRTQLENIRKAADYTPKNILFFTYAKLMNLPEEEIRNLQPDFIVLDEFHRAGAAEWGRGVKTLLSAFPDAKLLGLSATHIRYLDDQRDMADELFDNCIADQMSLAEAVSRGILPAPKYVVSFYAYRLEEEKYRSRMRRVSLPVRRQAEEYLEKLRRAIGKAEGLEKVFPKHMADPHGKYIVFCAGYEHMQEMIRKSGTWFRNADPAPHIYSVWAESPSAGKDYQAFREDASDHLRLLFCIDMFNEGIHVEGISGVILFRPTVSPIIYKQQIGRALSAMKEGTPVIFDIVNNFENLYTISALAGDVPQVPTFRANDFPDGPETVNPFRIIDEVRECRELFARLEDTLGLSWQMMYREARAFYDRNGHLNVPKGYKTGDGIPLGVWIMTQRRIRNGSCNGLLTEERIRLLDAIGMNWKQKAETAWDAGFAHAMEYKANTGNLDITARYVSPDGYLLGDWISAERRKYACMSARGLDPLSDPRFKALDDQGMIWSKSGLSFRNGLEAAQAYREKHGNLDVPLSFTTEDGFKLGQWIQNQRTRKKQSPDSACAAEELAQLDALGMVWQTKADRAWEKNYLLAKRFFEENGHLLPPYNYTVDRVNLWKWVCRQRDARKAQKLEEDRIRRLEAIGMQWTARARDWNSYYLSARNYFLAHGDLEVPPEYVTPEGIWLGRWLAGQRTARSRNQLTEDQVARLNALSMRWTNKLNDHWEEMFSSLTAWLQEQENRHSSLIMPRDTKARDGSNLFQWTRRQRLKRIRGQLQPDQQRKWDGIDTSVTAALNLQNHRIGSAGKEQETA